MEVCRNQQWGTTCSDGWDDSDARFQCQQLGFSDSETSDEDTVNARPGSGQIWMIIVNCSHIGDMESTSSDMESSISQCSDDWWNDTSQCDHSDDVTVQCVPGW